MMMISSLHKDKNKHRHNDAQTYKKGSNEVQVIPQETCKHTWYRHLFV